MELQNCARIFSTKHFGFPKCFKFLVQLLLIQEVIECWVCVCVFTFVFYVIRYSIQKKNVIFIHLWLFCFWTVLDTYIEAGKTHSKQYPFLSENGVVTVRVSRRKKGRINYLGTIHMCSRYIPNMYVWRTVGRSVWIGCGPK